MPAKSVKPGKKAASAKTPIPSLTEAQITAARVRLIRKRYARTVKMGDTYSTFLNIDHQGFTIVVTPDGERARWFAKMLAIALERFHRADLTLPVTESPKPAARRRPRC